MDAWGDAAPATAMARLRVDPLYPLRSRLFWRVTLHRGVSGTVGIPASWSESGCEEIGKLGPAYGIVDRTAA